MPHRFLQAVQPIVAHGVREMTVEGASLEHTLLEVALMGALVGSGVPATQAIRQVEALEFQLLGWHPGEAVEPYHADKYGKGKAPGMGGAYGKAMTPGMGGAYGKAMTPGMGGAYGKAMTPGMGGAYGKGKTPGMGGAYGKGMAPGMGAMGKATGTGAFGKAMTPGPFGKGPTTGMGTTTPYMGGAK